MHEISFIIVEILDLKKVVSALGRSETNILKTKELQKLHFQQKVLKIIQKLTNFKNMGQEYYMEALKSTVLRREIRRDIQYLEIQISETEQAMKCGEIPPGYVATTENTLKAAREQRNRSKIQLEGIETVRKMAWN